MKAKDRPFPRAFTMIEILMAISIIAILAGMLFIAMGHLSGSSKEKATGVTLGNAKAMLDSLNASTGLTKGPTYWCWWDGAAVINTSLNGTDVSKILNFWTIPYRVGGVATGYPEPLDAPGLIAGDDNVRNGSRAIVNTLIAMSFIAKLPGNQQAIQQLPANHLYVPDCIAGNQFARQVFAGIPGLLSATSDNVTYIGGVHVKKLDSSSNQMKYYECTANSTTTDVPGSDWRDETAAPRSAPLILDDWGNPIIFVPGSGLVVHMLNGKTAYATPPVPEQTFIIVSREGKVNGNGTTAGPTVVQPGRPFFVSAGPDGDFSKGDDNIYSFEQ